MTLFDFPEPIKQKSFIKEKDIIIFKPPKALKRISYLMAQLFTEHAKYQDRVDLHSRTTEERIKNRYFGCLAVYSVAAWLSQHEKFVRIFDFERTNFSSPDNWDLLVKSALNDKLLKVEIKSSGHTNNTPDLNTIIHKRTLAVKPGEQKDINIQVYFLPHDFKENIYFISWASKSFLNSLEDKGLVKSFNQNERRKRFSPFLKSYQPFSELLQLLK